MVSYIQTNLPVNDIVKLLHCWSRDSVGQEKFLAPSVDTQTHNYDTEYSNHHPAISTPKSKGLSHSKMIWWAIYIKLPVNAIARLPDTSFPIDQWNWGHKIGILKFLHVIIKVNLLLLRDLIGLWIACLTNLRLQHEETSTSIS